MKLFIKRSVSPDEVCFNIFDELSNQKYRACLIGSKSVFKIIIVDGAKNAVLKIRKIPLAASSAFVFKARRKKHITLLTVTSSKGISGYFYGNNWHIQGNLAAGCFSIIDVDNTAISNQIKHCDYIELEVCNSENELFCIATAVCASLFNTVDKLVIQTV